MLTDLSTREQNRSNYGNGYDKDYAVANATATRMSTAPPPVLSGAITGLRGAIERALNDKITETSEDGSGEENIEADPLKRFFLDEIATTRNVLKIVSSDLDKIRSIDDLKVSGQRSIRLAKIQ